MKIIKKQAEKQAEIELDESGVPWAACPYCDKKAIPLYPGTRVYNLHWKCQNTKCTQKYFIINYTDDLCLI